MKITFLGATGTVTGSKYLIEKGNDRLLVDCGLFQGLKDLRLRNWADFPFDPAKLQCVLLTHAHIDHSGALPLLMKRGFKGKIFCSPATFELCKILLPDAGKLQEEEAEYANRKAYSKHHPALPLYSRKDAELCLGLFYPTEFEKEVSIGENFRFKLSRVGHILGAAFITVFDPIKSIIFSGDVGRPDDPVIFSPDLPQAADYLVIESTYGDRHHDPRSVADALQATVEKTWARGGKVIIPAFSVGRTQTLLFLLHQLKKQKRISKHPIYLDSPMSIDVTEIFCRFQGEHRLSPDQCQEISRVANHIREQEASKALDQRSDSFLIISASGMATGGRVLHHLKAFLPDPKNTVLFAGFQAAGTRGHALLNGAKEVKMLGSQVQVGAEIKCIDNLSAHADQSELLDWMKNLRNPPIKTFVTHGEPTAAIALKTAIEKKMGWACVVPKYLDTIAL